MTFIDPGTLVKGRIGVFIFYHMDKEALQGLRHSAAHLLAAAVAELWPSAKRTIGPAIDTGFYYDFDFGTTKISETDFPAIEAKMQELVKGWTEFSHREVTTDEALVYFKDNEYKQELINEFAGEGSTLTFYTSGNFTDLCRGGHTEKPSEVLKHFKLLTIAGAYWRGDEKNKMLTRVYGTAFFAAEDLTTYLTQLEEARKRDHRRLGKELDLFVFSDLVGPGLPLYTPKGALVRRELQKFVNELQQGIGYQEVWTPQVTKADLFKTSGHYDKYKEDMFHVRSNYSEEEFFLKPMNCPMHTQLFASRARSYRDLPLRYSDFANLYRDERPGELSGLTRLRAFSQDDAHCFCREDQIEAEFMNVAKVIAQAIAKFGMTYWVRLSLWDPNNQAKYLGSPEVWERAQVKLESIVQRIGVEYKRVEGDAAIYGPKMDFIAVDALGREWQISTIQLDFIQPERFELEYTDADGQKKRPVMIHRAILGSPERFMGLLIEHTAGAFPVWLAPVQVLLAPVSSEKHGAGAEALAAEWRQAGIRVEVDTANETVGKKVRNASAQKIPYIVVAGDRELAGEPLSVKVLGQEEPLVISAADFVARVVSETRERSR